MTPWMRHVTALTLLAALLGGAAGAPQWYESLAGCCKALAEARQAARRERRRAEAMDRRGEVSLARLTAKSKVIRQLLAGDLTLLEAAAWFRYLNERPEWCQDNYRAWHPGATAEESACRQVIGWARAEVAATNPTQADALERRLEAELQGHLQCEGKVELPDL